MERKPMKVDLEERYRCDAGHPHAAWRPPADPAERRVWDKWINGLLATAAACFALGLIVILNGRFGPHEATARMERLLAHLDRMPAIRPETAQAITRIMSQRGYDCEQVACNARLAERNITVRFRLVTALAAKAPREELAASLDMPGEFTARRRSE
jgi:hypothetical protein